MTDTSLILLQINVNHCKLAHEMLEQITYEQRATVVIINDPLLTRRDWETDAEGFTSLWVVDRALRTISRRVFSCAGIVAVDVGEYAVFSCYLPPSLPFEVFCNRMDLVGTAVDELAKATIVCGDFNAKSPLWGSNIMDNRGKFLEVWAASHGLVPLAADGGPTFDAGGRTSVIDFAMVSAAMCSKWAASRVLHQLDSASDHNYVRHEFHLGRHKGGRELKQKRGRFDEKALLAGISEWTVIQPPPDGDRGAAEAWAADAIDGLHRRIMDSWVPLPRHVCGKPQVSWWNAEIAMARTLANKKRRALTKARTRRRDTNIITPLLLEYRVARKELHLKIIKAKENSWRELCHTVDRDKWGKPYQVVIRALTPPSPAQSLDFHEAKARVAEFFCTRPHESSAMESIRHERLRGDEEEADESPAVLQGDIIQIARRINCKKAAGPDGVPSRISKMVLLAAADRFARLFEGCTRLAVFPKKWKEARLVLIPKRDIKGEICGYRPLSVISGFAKIFELVIVGWLNTALEDAPLSESQYGFRQGRSTLLAIKRVMDTWDLVKRKGKHCMIVTLDVKNAFGRISRAHLIKSIKERNLPCWLADLLRDYLLDRTVTYATRDGTTLVEEVHAGVPQGSVLGPILWNMGYDGVLSVKVPVGVQLVGYADDLVVIVVDRDQDMLAGKASLAIEAIMRWMADAGLELATQKTEALLLTGRKRKCPIRFKVGMDWIETGKSLKYLGVVIQGNLTFTKHIEKVTSKAKRVAAALSRITPNTGGAGFAARMCFYRVSEAILLYASPNWDRALGFDLPRRRIRAAQRVALFSLVRAYRTVSWDALCVLAGQPPIDLVATERKKAFLRKWPGEITRPISMETEPAPMRYELRRRREERHDDDTIPVEDANSASEDTDPHRNGPPLQGNRQQQASKEAKARKEDRAETLKIWQEWWSAAKTGQRTRSMIANIEDWIGWGPRSLTYRLTQYISGHGCFAEFLYRIGKISTPECWHCPHPVDDAHHTMVQCPKWEDERRVYEEKWGLIEEHFLIKQLAENPERRREFIEFVEKVMRRKEELHSRREKEIRQNRDRNNT